MSEQFEAGLRDLYLSAEMSHEARPGLAVDLMIGRTRRHRRARAAAVTMATAAAVVGVAVAGTAVVQNMGGSTAPPAGTPTTEATEGPAEITGTATTLACDTALADVRQVPADWGVTLRLELDQTNPAPATVPGWIARATAEEHGAFRNPSGGGIPDGVEFAVVRDGVVVGTAEANLWEIPDIRGVTDTHDVRISPLACDGGTLPPGTYEMVASLPLEVAPEPESWEAALLLSEPVSFTMPEVGPVPDPTGHASYEYHSTVPPTDPAAPLRDGSYIGIVKDIDAAAGTVTADIVVMHFGQGALDWVAANDPGAEVMDDYVIDDSDGPTPRTLTVGNALIWDLCSGDDSIVLVQRTGGLAEWATAPIEDGESLCYDTSTIPISGLYWLDVRGGVVQQVAAQYVP